MSFNTDQQTLNDLTIFGKQGGHSIYELFNRTATRGGSLLLEEFFRIPLSDEDAINRRSGIIRYFSTLGAAFPCSSAWFDAIELYLSDTDYRTRLDQQEMSLGTKLLHAVGKDTKYQVIHQGVNALISLLKAMKEFLEKVRVSGSASPWGASWQELNGLVQDQALDPVYHESGESAIPRDRLTGLDILLRFEQHGKLTRLLACLYELDLYMAVGKVAAAGGFGFARALPKEWNTLTLRGVRHPALPDAVRNDLSMSGEEHILFLTGANMAGKSTLMKSLGISLYLAHIGFPVAAEAMEFSVRDGIYTSINLPDDLSAGASHFYAEALRLRKIARELSRSKALFVMFDELFRGTNVRDAGEATIAVTEAFAHRRNSLFVLSTHIIEAGEVLRERTTGINYACLPTGMEAGRPRYTYRLEAGISEDRHGMIIIQNEGILELLNKPANQAPTSH